MFGRHDLPIEITREDLTLHITREKNLISYTRKLGEKEKKKKVIGSAEIMIHPVEPIFIPKELTHKLLLMLDEPVILPPKAIEDIYLELPVEIGVFVVGRGEYEMIDVFAPLPQKMTLYGDAATGTLCKHWPTSWFTEPHEPAFGKGILRLTLSNGTDGWVTVTRTVLEAAGMRLYFNDRIVSMVGRMKISGKKLAETELFNTPLHDDMTKAHEMVEGRSLTTSRKFVMEGKL